MVNGSYISVITLNGNGLNAPTKDRELNGLKKQDPNVVHYERSTSDLGTHTDLKERGWKQIFHAYGNQNKAGVAILLSDKTDFKIWIVTRHEEEHYI